MSQTSTQHEDKNLFSFIEVEGYQIKQLSFGELAKISPDLTKIVDKVHDNFPELTSLTITTKDIIKIILFILPDITPIVAKLIGEDVKTVEEMPATKVVTIAATIWNLNKDIFRNFFSVNETEMM